MSEFLYGRKYRVRVIDGKNVALDVSNLRCTFNIVKVGLQVVNYGDLTIYNLSPNTEDTLVREGMRVIIEAGYQGVVKTQTEGAAKPVFTEKQYGVIFDGDVYQCLRDRENVTDYKLTLHCLDGDGILNKNFVKFTANAGINHRDMINYIANQATLPTPIGKITPDLSTANLPRGKVFFGEPKKYFRQIAQDNNAQWWVDEGQLHVSKITDIPADQALVVTPRTGLIDTPIQNEFGVSFKCLLDPRIKVKNPPMMVKLDMTYIRQQKITYGQLPTLLDQDGLYKVAKVTHTGDTRGNEWYTEVEAISSPGKIPLMLSSLNQSPN